MPHSNRPIALSELPIGSCATLTAMDLPEEIQGQLSHLGFLQDTRILAVRHAPAGDPTVYCVDGAEIALRRETARLITVQDVCIPKPESAQ